MANAMLVLDDEEEGRDKDLPRIEYCVEFFKNFNDAFKESLPDPSGFILEMRHDLGNYSSSKLGRAIELEKMDDLVELFKEMKEGKNIDKERVLSSIELLFLIKEIFG
jgi:hypothetical protein